MVPGAGGYELKRDDGTSAAEQLARLVPKGCVVTAFTSISSALIRDPPSGEKPTVFPGAGDEAARMQKLLDDLESLDDVQEVYTTAVVEE